MDGLFRSNATERDRVRRQLVGITTVAGLSACAAVGGLLVGLVPADAGQRSGHDQQRAAAQQAEARRAAALAEARLRAARTDAERAAAQRAAAEAEAAAATQQQQSSPPVATSGGS